MSLLVTVRRAAVFACAAFMCSPSAAQRASVVRLDDSSTAAAAGPTLQVNGLPVPGESAFRVRIADVARGSLGQLVISSSLAPRSVPGVETVLFPGVPWQRVSLPPEAVGGGGSIGLGSGPVSPALAGMDFVLQGVVVDGTAPRGVTLTQGLALTFGEGQAAAPLFELQRIVPRFAQGNAVDTPPHIADVDGDGLDDLTTSNADGNIAIRYALGGGFFTDAVTLTLPPAEGPAALQPDALVVVDFDGDGHNDVVSLLTTDVVMRMDVFYGLGDSAFAPPISTTPFVDFNARSALAADIDGDGIGDIVADLANDGNFAAIVLGAANRVTEPAIRAETGTPISSKLLVGDLDVNGIQDLLTVRLGTNEVHFTLGTLDETSGALMYSPPQPFETGGVRALQAALGDVDEDGLPELLVAHEAKASFPQAPTAIVIHPNLGGTFGAPIIDDTEIFSGRSLALVDATGNGHLDIVVRDAESISAAFPSGVAYADDFVRILEGRGDGTFDEGPTQSIEDVSFMGLAQFDHDNIYDYYANPFVLLGTNEPIFAPFPPAIPTPFVYFVADVNGDGLGDIVSPSNASADDIAISLNRGDGTFDESILSPADGWDMRTLAFGDIDNDGHVDIVTTETVVFSWKRGDGTGAFGPTLAGATCAPGATRIRLEHVDADGRLDVITAYKGDVVISMSNGPASWTSSVIDAPVALLTGWETGDVNGDGHLDLVVAGCDDEVVICEGDGSGAFSLSAPIPWPVAARWVALLDIDDDGDIDILAGSKQGIAARSTATPGLPVLVTPLAGDTPDCFSGSTFFLPDVVLTADFNGDGRTDLATTREHGASAAVHLTRGDGALNAPVFIGSEEAFVAYAEDLNADGRPDIASTRVYLNRGFERAVTETEFINR